MKKIIDISTFSRRIQYENFKKYTNPTFSVDTRLDVTAFLKYCKKNNRSFFSEFLFIVMRAANEIEEFRLRFDDGKIVCWDYVHPSYIVLREDGKIVTCLTEYVSDGELFYQQNRKDIQIAKTETYSEFNSSGRTDCLYVSCVPWVDLTSITHPYNFDDKEQTSIPRIAWSKYVETNGRIQMGLSISVHHAFADGLHVAGLISKIQDYINAFDGGTEL